MNKSIAYIINQYPQVSHSFIRREILALEQLGFDVLRIALRGWDAELVDPVDQSERKSTRYVLQGGLVGLFVAGVQALVRSPLRFWTTLRLAFKMSRHADRSLLFHLVYMAEACVVLDWVKRHGVQHMHAHFGTNSAEVVMLANALGGTPYSFTVHGPEEFDKPQFIGLGEKIRRASFVVAISSYGRSQLYRWVEHTQWQKIKVVHCGLEKSFYQVPAKSPPDLPKLVCVGRLCEQKGQLLLIEAMATLVARGTLFDLVLAGDGEMRSEVEAMVVRYGLSGRVRITGWISSEQVRDEILACRAMVLPSFAEGLPVVLMEAMALRRPVLTTVVAGIPELVRSGETGWLFSAGSVEELVDAIEACLLTPVSLLEAMGDAAYARVVARHCIDNEAKKLAVHFSTSMKATAP